MKGKNKSNFLIFAATLCGIWVITIGRTIDPATAQFKLFNGYLIVIPVTVNGSGPYEFLLDTGSNTTLIHTEFARELRLRPVDRVELVTVSGSQVVPRAQLESLAIGAKAAKNLEALFSDLREIRAVNPKIRGALGMNFLAQFNFLIDYRERRIEFEDGDELEKTLRGARLPIERNEGRTLITWEGKERWRLALDSGTSTLILFNSGERMSRLDWGRDDPESMRLTSDIGSRIIQRRRLRRFDIGGAKFLDLPVALCDMKDSGEARIENGLLPTSIFQIVYFNHRKNFVTLNPRNSGGEY